MRNIVGPNVKIARHKFSPRLTQAELAIKLQLDGWHINRSGVAKIEMGYHQVTDIQLLKLADALNVNILWLLGKE
jgi:transcriptional regulator with XRE-family HTH domain